MTFAREDIEITTPGERVPAILIRPRGDGPLPAALLLHGLSSSRERMSDSIGRALAARGIASLAIDLPLHGLGEGDVRTRRFGELTNSPEDFHLLVNGHAGHTRGSPQSS